MEQKFLKYIKESRFFNSPEDENCESDYEIIINSRKYILEELLYKMESKRQK